MIERIKTLETAIDFTNNQVKEIIDSKLLAIDKQFSKLTTKMCFNMLDLDTHREESGH